MDHDMPFCIASAHYCLGAVVEATIDIITASQKELAWDLAHPSPTDRRHSCDLFWVNGEALTPTSDVVDWRALGVGPILKWADDLIPFRFPVASGKFSIGQLPLSLQYGNYSFYHSSSRSTLARQKMVRLRIYSDLPRIHLGSSKPYRLPPER